MFKFEKMGKAITIKMENGVPTITVRFTSCDLKKATTAGLEYMLWCLVQQEMFEEAAVVWDEIKARTKV